MNDAAITGKVEIMEIKDQQTAQQGWNSWPDWRTALLKQFWQQGLTGSQIALRLGMTRNAVVGKRWRLGLAPRQTPRDRERQQNLRRAKRAAKERERRQQPGYSPPKRQKPQLPGDIYMVDSKRIASIGVPLEKLTWNGSHPSNCRAIVSEDKAKQTLYCGLPVWESESYCAAHCRRFFNRFAASPSSKPLAFAASALIK
jgi:GcrA cell cycle regulator